MLYWNCISNRIQSFGYQLSAAPKMAHDQKRQLRNPKPLSPLTVRGIVQGVNFRWFTQRHASELMLKGYVRNTPDGSVQVVVEGPRETIEQLLDSLRVGPSAAVVESVKMPLLVPPP